MPKVECGRRQLLRLIALSGAVVGELDQAAAHPTGRHAAPISRAPTVVIDPGHGGVDPGAISPSGTYEKDIVLSMAWDFARRLAATRRYRVMLTRRSDEFIALRDRLARARAWRADLFLSIHANRLPDAEIRGLSVFTLSAQPSDREAAALAARENRADLLGGINLVQQLRGVGDVLPRSGAPADGKLVDPACPRNRRPACARDRPAGPSTAFRRFRGPDRTRNPLGPDRARLPVEPARSASADAACLPG